MIDFQAFMISQEWIDILVRLSIAAVLGGLVGFERQVHGHWAGFRTPMLVSLGTSMFVIAGIEVAAEEKADLTRVIQGVITGIGFLGAGMILKLGDQIEIKGLTTASSIWLAAAAGTACGLAQYRLAIAGTFIALVVLWLLRPLEKAIGKADES